MKNKPKQKRNRHCLHFDSKGIKKAIKNDLYSRYTSNEKNKPNINVDQISPIMSKEEEDTTYNNKYRKYISEEFNSTIVNMLVIYINRNKSFPKKYQNESNFIYKFINLLKHLFMNEFEISYFTILLDKIGWRWANLEHWTYFCILGIYTKKLCGREDDSSLLINIISRNNPDFMDYYTNFICDDEIINKAEGNEVTVKIINERFKQLTTPTNSFCRKNFINYNGIVDKIVKLSQPYGEQSIGNQLKSNEQFISNNGIIDNEMKLLSTINGSVIPQMDYKYNYNNNYNYLKNNLLMQPMPSITTMSQKKKNIGQYIPCQSIVNMSEINPSNYSNINLNLMNRESSQFSLKIDKFINI